MQDYMNSHRTYTSILDVENLEFFLIEIKTIGGDLFFGRVLSPGMTHCPL